MNKKLQKKLTSFDYEYFKYKHDLIYLFKIVHNKDMLKSIKNDKDEYNGFCSFVFYMSNNQYKINKHRKKKWISEERTDQMLYIYNFLKKYESEREDDLFKNLSFAILEDYLFSVLEKLS
jgi:hypothetical protein